MWDADAHICEPPEVWREYADPAFRDRVLQVRKHADGHESLVIEGRDLGTSPAPACIPGAYADPKASWDDILPGSYDPLARLGVMDDEGLEAVLDVNPRRWLAMA